MQTLSWKVSSLVHAFMQVEVREKKLVANEQQHFVVFPFSPLIIFLTLVVVLSNSFANH